MKVPGFWILSFICLTIFAKSIADEPRVVCYYTNWSIYRPGNAKYSPQNINPYLCTHLIYAFGGFTKDNTLQPFDKYQDIEKGGYAKFTGLKTYNKNLKTLLAIGGWNEASSRFSPLVGDADRRRTFVKNAVKYLRQNHFDGLDLDWEYPTFRDGGKLKDRVNYAQFVQELREEFDRESSKTGRPRLLLTLAIPAGVDKIDQGYDVVKLNQYLDWFNVLTYDYHDSFEPATNHHAPLYSLEEDNEYNYDSELNIDFSVKHLINVGADRQKLVLGIPTYGRSYTLFNPEATDIGAPTDGPGEPGDATREKGFLAYYEICQNIKNDEDWTVMHPNDNVMGPYLYKDDQWISYDDEKMARKKAQYVAKNGLGGIMFWSIDTDDFRGTCSGKPYPLIEAAKDGLYNALGVKPVDSKETVVKTPTRNRNRPTKKPLISNEASTNLKDSFTRRQKPAQTQTAKPTKSTESSIVYNLRTTTPEPPTTPDPGSDFKCEDEGFFPHPRDCKKYFWCLDSGPSNLGIVAHQFTCPSGLVFNKQADSCDYARNVVCSKTKPSTTTTGAPPTTTSKTTTRVSTTQRTTTFRTTTSRPTTTSTTPAYEYDDEEYDDEIENTELDRDIEDPKVIKELIDLIKKAGGLDKLEKHLKISEDNLSVFAHTKSDKLTTTQATFSKSLYDKVLIRKPENRFVKTEDTNTKKIDGEIVAVTPKVNNTRYSSVYRNSRPSPQNAGLENLSEFDAFLKEKPQYVTIQRHRSTTAASENDGEDGSEEDSEEEYSNADTTTRSVYQATSQPQYVNIQRNRFTTESTASGEDESEEIVQNPFSRPIESVTASQYATINRSRKPASDDSVQISLLSDRETATQYTTINRGRRPIENESGEISVSTYDTDSAIKYSSINRGRKPDNRDPSTETESSIEVESTTQYTTVNRRRRPENDDITEVSSSSEAETTTQYSTINRRRRPETSSTSAESTTQYSTINRRRRPESSSVSDSDVTTQTAEVSSTVNSRFRTRYQSINRGASATFGSQNVQADEKVTTQEESVDKYSESGKSGEVEVPIKRVFPELLNTNTKYQTVTRNQIKTTILDTADGINIPLNNITDLIAENSTQKETPPPPTQPSATPDINQNLIGFNLNTTNNELTTNHNQFDYNLTNPTNTINITANQIHTDTTFTFKPHQPSNDTYDVQHNTVENVTEFITTQLSSPRPFGFQKPNKTILLNQTRAPKVSQVENLEPYKNISNPVDIEKNNLGRRVGVQDTDIKPLIDRTRFSFSSVTSPASNIDLVDQTVTSNQTKLESRNSTTNVGSIVSSQDKTGSSSYDRRGFRISSNTVSNSNVNFEPTTRSDQTIVESQTSTRNSGSNVNNQESKYIASSERGGFRFSSDSNQKSSENLDQIIISNQTLPDSQKSTTTSQVGSNQFSFDRRGFRISSTTGQNLTKTESGTTNSDSNSNTQEGKFQSSSVNTEKNQSSFDRRGFRISSSTSPNTSAGREQTNSFGSRGTKITSTFSFNSIIDGEQTTVSSQNAIESQNKTTLGYNASTKETEFQSSFDRRGFKIASTASTDLGTGVEQATSFDSIESQTSNTNSGSDVIAQQINYQSSLITNNSEGTTSADLNVSTDIEQTTFFDLQESTTASLSSDFEQTTVSDTTLLESQNSTSNLGFNIRQETELKSTFDRRGFRISSSTSPNPIEQKTYSGESKLKVKGFEQTTGSDQASLESQNFTSNLGLNISNQESEIKSKFDRRGFRISSATSPKPIEQETTSDESKFKVKGFEQTIVSNQASLESQNSTSNLGLNTGNEEAELKTTTVGRRGFRISSSTSPNPIEQETTSSQSKFKVKGFEQTIVSDQAPLESQNSTNNLGLNISNQEAELKTTTFDRRGFRISSSTSPNPIEQKTNFRQNSENSQKSTQNDGSYVNSGESQFIVSSDRGGFRYTSDSNDTLNSSFEQTSQNNRTTNRTLVKLENSTVNLGSTNATQTRKFESSSERQGFQITSATGAKTNTDFELSTISSQESTKDFSSNVNTQEMKYESSFDRRGFRISASTSQTPNSEQVTISSQNVNESEHNVKSEQPTVSTESSDINISGNTFQSSFNQQGFQISSLPSSTSIIDVEETTTNLDQSVFATESENTQEPEGFEQSTVSNVRTTQTPITRPTIRRGFRVSSSTTSKPSIDLEQTTSSSGFLFASRNSTVNQRVNSSTGQSKSTIDRNRFRVSTSTSRPTITDQEPTTTSSEIVTEPRSTTVRTINRNRGNRKFFSPPTTEATVDSVNISNRNNVTRKYRPVYEDAQEPVNYNSLLNRDVRPSNLDELSSLTAFDFNRQNYNTRNPTVRRRPRPTTVRTTTTQEPSTASIESNTSTDDSTKSTTETVDTFTNESPNRNNVIRRLRPVAQQTKENVDYNSLLNRNIRPGSYDEFSSLTAIDLNRKTDSTGNLVVRRRPRPTVATSTTPQEISLAPTETESGTERSRSYKKPLLRNQFTRPSTTTTSTTPVILPNSLDISSSTSSQTDISDESPESTTLPAIILSLTKSFDFGFASRNPNSTVRKVFENDPRSNSTTNVSSTTEQTLEKDTTTAQLIIDEQNSLNVTTENNQTTNIVTNTNQSVLLSETKPKTRVRTVKRLRDPVKNITNIENTIDTIDSTESQPALDYNLSNPTIEQIVNEGFNFQTTDTTVYNSSLNKETDSDNQIRRRLSTTTPTTVESENQTDSSIQRRRQFQTRTSTTATTLGNSSVATNGSRVKVVNRTFRKRPSTKLEINSNSTLVEETIEPSTENTNTPSVSRFNARTRRPLQKPKVDSEESIEDGNDDETVVDKELASSTQKNSFSPPRRAFTPRTFSTTASTTTTNEINVVDQNEVSENIISTSGPRSTIRPRFKVNRTFTRRPFTQLEVTSEPVDEDELSDDDKEIDSNSQIETSSQTTKKFASRFSATQTNQGRVTGNVNTVNASRFKARPFTRKPTTTEPNNNNESVEEENVPSSSEELEPGLEVESTTKPARRTFVSRPFISSTNINKQLKIETESQVSDNIESSTVQQNSARPTRKKFISRVATTPRTQVVSETINSTNASRYNLLNRTRKPFNGNRAETTVDANLGENDNGEDDSVSLNTESKTQVLENIDLSLVASTNATLLDDESITSSSEDNISSSTEEASSNTSTDPLIKPRRRIKVVKGAGTKKPSDQVNSNETVSLTSVENEDVNSTSSSNETTTLFPNLEINAQDEDNLPSDDKELEFDAEKILYTSTQADNEETNEVTEGLALETTTFENVPFNGEEIESSSQTDTSTESRTEYSSTLSDVGTEENINTSNGSRYKVRTFTRRPTVTQQTTSSNELDEEIEENASSDSEDVLSNVEVEYSTPTRRTLRPRFSTTTPSTANIQTNDEAVKIVNPTSTSRFRVVNRKFTRKPTGQTEISSTPSVDGDSSVENTDLASEEEIDSQPKISTPTRRTFRPRISTPPSIVKTQSNRETEVRASGTLNTTSSSRFKVLNRTFPRRPSTQGDVSETPSVDDNSEENSALEEEDEIESDIKLEISTPTRRTLRPRFSTTPSTINTQTNGEAEVRVSENVNSNSRFKVFNRTFTRKPSTQDEKNNNSSEDDANSEENLALDEEDVEANTQPEISSTTRRTFRPRFSTTPSTVNSQTNKESEIEESENINSTSTSRFKVFNRTVTRKPLTQSDNNNKTFIANDDNSEENSALDDEEIESNTQPEYSTPTRRTLRPRISTTASSVNTSESDETQISVNINSTSTQRFKFFNRTVTQNLSTEGEINKNSTVDDDSSEESSTIINDDIESTSQNDTFGNETNQENVNTSSDNEELESNNDTSTTTRRTFVPIRISTTASTLNNDSEVQVTEGINSLRFNLGNRTRKPFGQREVSSTKPDDVITSDEASEDEEEIEPNSQIDATTERRKYISRITTTPTPPPLRFKVFNRPATRKPSTTPDTNSEESDDNIQEDQEVEDVGIVSSPKYKTFERTTTRRTFTRPEVNVPENVDDAEESEELESNSQLDSNSQTERKYVSRISQTNSETETRVSGSTNAFNAPRYGVIIRTRKPFTRPAINQNESNDNDYSDENNPADDEDVEGNTVSSNVLSNSGNIISLNGNRYGSTERRVTRRPLTRLQINANEPDDTENEDGSEEFESNSETGSNSQTGRIYTSRTFGTQSNSETESRFSSNANTFNVPRYGVVNRTRKPFTRPEINSNGDDKFDENSSSYNAEVNSYSQNDLTIQPRKKFTPRISNSPISLNIQSNSESGSRVSGNVPRYRPVSTRPSPNFEKNSNDYDSDDNSNEDENGDRFEENLTGNGEGSSSYSKFDTSTQSIRKFKPRISTNSVNLNTQTSSETSLPSGYRNKAIFQRKPYVRPVYTNEDTDSDNSEESVTTTSEDESNTERGSTNDDDVVEETTIMGEFISESETPSILNNNFTQTVESSEGSLSTSEETNSSLSETLRFNKVDSENETESEFDLNRNDLDAGLVISSESNSFNTPATPKSSGTAKVINRPFSGTLNSFSKSQDTQFTGSQNSPIQSTNSNKYIPLHLRQQNTFNKKGVLTTTPPQTPSKFSHEEFETATGSISYTDYTNIPHSTTLDTSTPIISTIADINLYNTLISQESTTTVTGDEIDKVTEATIVPLKKLKSTTTSKPTTLHHIFAVDYDSAEEDRNNGTNLGNSTELSDDDDSNNSKEVSAEEISQRLEKLVEINRIVEIYSKQRSNGHNDLSSNSNELIVEKIPTIDKIGEISRWISVKLQNHNSTSSKNFQEILQNITQLEQTLNSTVNTTFHSGMIFDVETSTIPLEGLFDKTKKNLNDNEVIEYPITNSPSPSVEIISNLDSFTGATSFGVAAATIPSHNYVQQLRPESHEANPLVISIANLDQVVLSKSDKIDKKISFPSVIGTPTESPNQLTFSSNLDPTN